MIKGEENQIRNREPEEDVQEPEEGELTLIDPETFWDLLMEQQEQM